MVTADVFDAVELAANWLDENNGCDRAEQTMRLLKVTEEAGEVAAAWVGATGQNPRKGITHTYDQVGAELADVVMAALVAMTSIGLDPQHLMTACAAKITDRLNGRDIDALISNDGSSLGRE